MKIDLNPVYLEIVKDIISKNAPGLEIWVFGSRVNGTAKKFSDLDLAIISPEPLTLNLMTKLQNAFSESDLPIKIDIVDWSAISEEFKKIILKNHQTLFSK